MTLWEARTYCVRAGLRISDEDSTDPREQANETMLRTFTADCYEAIDRRARHVSCGGIIVTNQLDLFT